MHAIGRQFDPWPASERALSPRRVHVEAAVVSILATALDLAAGLYINLALNYTKSDAFSRVANAFYVLYSRTPHLAAIGFVWNPLPSLLELLLVPLKALWPPLVTSGVAAVVWSAVFGGLAVYLLVEILAEFHLSPAFRASAGILFALNPLIIFYGANGMTEVMLIATMLGTLLGVLRYLGPGNLATLTAAALWLAVGFSIRYEAAPFGVFVGLALAAALRWRGVPWRRIESALLLLLAPLVYVSGLWLYLNWLIMKNPLFFMDGTYSNAAFSSSGSYQYALLGQLKGHPLDALAFVASMTLLFWPVIPAGLIALGRLLGRLRDGRMLLLFAMSAVPLLQFALLERGLSSGLARYFIYFIPMGVLLVALLVADARTCRRSVLLVLAALALALGDLGTGYAVLTSPILGHGDRSDLLGIVHGRPTPQYVARNQVVTYLNAHPTLTVLTDSAYAYPIIVRVHNPRQLIIDSDADFQSILENPRGRVDAFLVPDIAGGHIPDAVSVAWPGMSSGKVTWVRLIASFRSADMDEELYRILPNAP